MSTLLLKIGQLSIVIYGFFIALSFIVGILFAKQAAKRAGADQAKIMDLCFYLLLAAIFGSRLFYIILNPGMFLADPLEVIKIWRGGLVFYGGLATALATGLIFLRKVRLPFWKTADILAPSAVLSHFIVRLGCFFAGCCFAKSFDSSWAVSTVRAYSIIPRGAPLQPAQLYSALNSLLIFGILLSVRKYKKFDGQVFWVCVLLYGIARLLLGIFYADIREHSFYGILSLSQLFSGFMAVSAGVMLVYLGRKTRRSII